MNEPPPSSQPNVLGDTSLRLGIASTALVFATGLCALLGARQGWNHTRYFYNRVVSCSSMAGIVRTTPAA